MASYDDLLYELGELPSIIKVSSPGTQLAMLLAMNTGLFLASELIRKFFSVDVLNVMGGFTGARMQSMPTTAQPQQQTGQRFGGFASTFRASGPSPTKPSHTEK